MLTPSIGAWVTPCTMVGCGASDFEHGGRDIDDVRELVPPFGKSTTNPDRGAFNELGDAMRIHRRQRSYTRGRASG
jgi:hypothetical protein